MAADVVAGRYELTKRVGRGGAGEVWQAWDQQLEREVAVKRLVLMPPGAADDGHPSQSRALREARAAARLRHGGAVTIYDVIEEDGVTHLIMEFVDAPDLAQLIARDGPLSPPRAAALGMDLAGTLRAAHQLGVVHRDVKPSNVLVPPDGRPRLTDFGTALLVGDDRLTTSGLVIGSPAYMSPEQARGEPVDHRTDLWSLGATLYHAIEGSPPFAGGTPLATAHAVTTAPPRHPVAAGPLAPLLLQLLIKDPDDRPSVQQVEETLRRHAADPPQSEQVIDVRSALDRSPVARSDPKSRVRMVAAAVILLLGAGALFGVYQAVQPVDADAVASTPAPEVVAQSIPSPSGALPSAAPSPPPEVAEVPATPATIAVTEAQPVAGPSVAAESATPESATAEPAAVEPAAVEPAATESPATESPATESPATLDPTRTEAPAAAGPEFGEIQAPADWVAFDPDHAPYVVQHPADWTVNRLDGTRTDISDPASAAYLRLDWTDDPKPDALQDWMNYEQDFGPSHAGYQRLRLEPITYKGEPAAIWEYSYDSNGGRVHAYNLNVAGKDYGYALNFQTQDEDWERHRPLFDAFAGSYAITG